MERIPGPATTQLHHSGYLPRERHSTRCWPGPTKQTQRDELTAPEATLRRPHLERFARRVSIDLDGRAAGLTLLVEVGLRL